MRISDWSSDVCSSDLDVEVSPRRAVLDEALQELRGGDRAAGPPATDVLHVGDVAVDLLVVLAAERQAPQRLANRLAGGSELRRQLVVVAEQAGVLVTERDDDGAGQRCQIRSEEHTSELQSLMRISYAVFCFKKKKANEI